MDTPTVHPVSADSPLAPETREEMFRAFQRIASGLLTDGSDTAHYRSPIFKKDERDDLLARLGSCDDAVFLEITRTFLEECGHARRRSDGTRLVFAQSFIDDLREGLRDVDEPMNPEALSHQMGVYRKVLEFYAIKMGGPTKDTDDKTLRLFIKKISELARHLTEMNYYTESRGQGDLVVALLYKIYKLLDVPQTFAFAQMTLDTLRKLCDEYTLVESRYGFSFAEFITPYLQTLQTRLEARANAIRTVESGVQA